MDIRIIEGLHVWGPFHEADAAALDAIEHELGAALPVDYRAFVSDVGGGTVPYAVWLPPGARDAEAIQFDHLVTVDGLMAERAAYLAGSLPEVMPPSLLPVARDGGGSMLYVDLADGAVWAFVTGLPAWAGEPAGPRGGRLAASWSDYLAMLRMDPDYARDVWEDRHDADPEWVAALEAWLDDGLPDWRDRGWA